MRNFTHSQLQPGELVLIKYEAWVSKAYLLYYFGLHHVPMPDSLLALITTRNKYGQLHVRYLDPQVAAVAAKLQDGYYRVDIFECKDILGIL